MSENPGDPDPPVRDTSFEERLQAARGKRGLDQPAPKAKTESSGIGQSPWGIGLRVGVELLSALIVGLGIGWGLDRWLHTGPLFLVLFVLAGGAAGVLNVWRMMAPKRNRQTGG